MNYVESYDSFNVIFIDKNCALLRKISEYIMKLLLRYFWCPTAFLSDPCVFLSDGEGRRGASRLNKRRPLATGRSRGAMFYWRSH